MMSNHRDNQANDQDIHSRLVRLEASRGGKWWRRATITLIALAVSVPFAADALGPVPNTFSAGGVISASEMNENFAHLVAGITANENQVPSGAVAFFDADACPTGWSTFAPLQGRVPVGTPSGGSLRAEVGTALENGGSRTITEVPTHLHAAGALVGSAASGGAHMHPVAARNTTFEGSHTHPMSEDGDHRHTITMGGGGGTSFRPAWSGTVQPGIGTYNTPLDGDHTHTIEARGSHQHTVLAHNTDSAGAHTHTVAVSGNTASSGAASVDVTMPYVQLLACRRD